MCRRLAEDTRELDNPGVAGLELAPKWFAQRAAELGLSFAEPIPQRLHVLRGNPARPGADGCARQAAAADGPLVADWLIAFAREAVPHEPTPPRAELEKAGGEGRYLLWDVHGKPVSLAGTARRTRNVAAIAPVYTPPALRGRGYAGSVTATLPGDCSRRARRRSACTRTSGTLPPTDAMPGSASSPCATPGSICGSKVHGKHNLLAVQLRQQLPPRSCLG